MSDTNKFVVEVEESGVNVWFLKALMEAALSSFKVLSITPIDGGEIPSIETDALLAARLHKQNLTKMIDEWRERDVVKPFEAEEIVYIHLSHPEGGNLTVSKAEIMRQPYVWLTECFISGPNYGKRLLAIHYTDKPHRGILTGATLLGKWEDEESDPELRGTKDLRENLTILVDEWEKTAGQHLASTAFGSRGIGTAWKYAAAQLRDVLKADTFLDLDTPK